MRPPVEIPAPPFPARLPWLNVASLRMDKQVGRPVLVEFWDFCRVNSLRTLPYVREWHRRYERHGLRVVGVHCPGFEPSRDEDAVRKAVDRLAIEHPVALDTNFELWALYGNRGWPARYLWNQRGVLFEYHYGEGAYEETERAILELLDIDGAPMAPVRPEDAPGARLAAQTQDVPGPYSGPYAAGGVSAVLSGTGGVTANDRTIQVQHPGCYSLIEHDRHTESTLDLKLGDGITCHAVCFTPGLR